MRIFMIIPNLLKLPKFPKFPNTPYPPFNSLQKKVGAECGSVKIIPTFVAHKEPLRTTRYER